MNAPCSCWDSYRWDWHTGFPARGGPCALAFSLAAFVWLLQVEVENFVLRVAAEFSSRKEQLVFLINNYDMMLGVLMVMPLFHGVPRLVSSTSSALCPGSRLCLQCGVAGGAGMKGVPKFPTPCVSLGASC